ncbi:hypothetical protein [Flavobacterium phage FL-1]|nr:hypothetical protein [Flavobacterium phage FL-1]
MAILTEIIPPQGFDLVGNRIAEIITEEISNQVIIQNFSENVEVFLERIEPMDKSEDVMISVALRQGDFEGQTLRDVQGNYTYFIDLFTSGWAEETGQIITAPSIVSKDKLYRYMGLIRYILSSGKLNTLGFPPGLIGGKYIKRVMIDTDYSNFGNHSNYDGSYIRFARFIFDVRVQETQLLWDSIPLLGNNTNFTYEDTPKGTQLIFNN